MRGLECVPLVLLLGLNSCMALTTTFGDCACPGPRIYSGTVAGVRTLIDQTDPFLAFAVIDLPFTFVVDTALLPYTVCTQTLFGNRRGMCLCTQRRMGEEAKEVLYTLRGSEFRDRAFRRGRLRVGCNSYDVYVRGVEDDELLYVPLRTDGDAADFYRRVTGKKHPTLKGELSEQYKAFLEVRGR